jgi:hypothetical protein
MGVSSGQVAVTKEGALQSAIQKEQVQAKLLRECISHLVTLKERLIGPDPQNVVAATNPVPGPNCQFEELRVAQNDVSEAINQLGNLIGQISDSL